MSNITHDEDEDIIEHGHTPLYSNNNRREDVFDDTPNEDNDRPYGYDNNPVLKVDGDNRDHGLEDDEGNGEHGFEDDEDKGDRGFEDDEHNHNDLDTMDIKENNRRPNSPQAGQKHPRRDSDPDQPTIDKFRKAIKVKKSKGKPKADDWESDVQEILTKAILFYEIRLVMDGLFPDHMEEVKWAKIAWLDGVAIVTWRYATILSLLKW